MNAVDELNFLLGIGPPRPQLPLTLQRSGYTSVRALGKGSFGQAFLVFHKERGQYYVVKHVNMTNMTSRQRKDAYNEISVLQQLHHPNIVRYVEYFEEHPHLYIVMEYADGGDLYTHLQKISRLAGPSLLRQGLNPHSNNLNGGGGLLTEAQVISLFVQTTMAVKCMHDRRLLHRDIKSQNVFLTRNHVVKLGDFGITTVLQNTVAMASTMCGTPCYFSPELCQGHPYNNKSDVWALGVLLYELCAGTLPFESTTMKALMKEIVNKQPRRIPACFSDELWKLIQWMLQKNPKLRPDAGQVLLQPVLMRRVPDIIAQLKSVQFNDISPKAGAKSAASSPCKQNDGEAQSQEQAENVYVTDTEPYQQLLAQQQREAGAGKLGYKANGPSNDPFAGAVRPGNATGGYASGLGVRPAGQAPPSPRATPLASCAAGEKKPAAAAGAMELTPGQKAAQAVLQQLNGKAKREEKPVANHKSNNGAAAAAANGGGGAKPRPISDLLAQFDAEKKRIANSKHASSDGVNGAKKPTGTSEAAEKKRKGSVPPPLSDAVIADKDDGVDANGAAAAAAQQRKNNKDLGAMLKEMTGHFASFASVRMAKDGEVILLPGSPPPPPPPPRGSASETPLPADKNVTVVAGAKGEAKSTDQSSGKKSNESTPASDFSDPAGAKLDIKSLQEQPPMSPQAHASLTSTSLKSVSRLAMLNGGVLLNGANADKLFTTSFNKHFDRSAKASVQSAISTAVKAGKTPTATAAVDSNGKATPQTNKKGSGSGAEGGGVFTGSCLCGVNGVSGFLSLIYGSFVCTCEACQRLNSGGVEWLHLPNVAKFSEIACGATAASTAAGGGAAAAAALKNPPQANGKQGGGPARTYEFRVRISDENDDDDDDEGDEGTSKKPKPAAGSHEGVFDRHFCSDCGATLALLHDDLEGLLLPKCVLSEESLATLSKFAMTVFPSDAEEDI